MTLGLEFELPPTMISFSYEYLVILAFTRTLKILINNHLFDMGFGNWVQWLISWGYWSSTIYKVGGGGVGGL